MIDIPLPHRIEQLKLELSEHSRQSDLQFRSREAGILQVSKAHLLQGMNDGGSQD